MRETVFLGYSVVKIIWMMDSNKSTPSKIAKDLQLNNDDTDDEELDKLPLPSTPMFDAMEKVAAQINEGMVFYL